jgi:uncharacterized BrkB/YihY/UPF0761 family membrane protein
MGPDVPPDETVTETSLGADAPVGRRRVREMVGRGRRWTVEQQARAQKELESRRETSSVVGAGFDIADLDVHVGGGILAGAVAFRLFLFLVPFVYILFTVVGLVARNSGQNPEQLAKTLGITGILASAVVNTQQISVVSQIFLVLGASVALVITANSLVKTVFVVHWLVWGIPRAKPSGIRPIGAVIGLTLVMVVLSVCLNDLRDQLGLAGSILVVLLVTAISFAAWWWVSWQLPHAPVAARDLVPGAVVVAIGADAMHVLTVYWIGAVVARKSNTYGAIGIALAVLLWVYLFGRVLVASAGVNTTLWRRRQVKPGSPQE